MEFNVDERAVRVVADIGGTNARFAFVHVGETELHGIKNYHCADFSHFVDAVRAYLSHVTQVDSFCLAIAGPVEQDWIDLPNNHWTFSQQELQQTLGVPITVINDFSAQALSLSALTASDLLWVGDPRPSTNSDSITAVVGPGTGLGVSAILPSEEIIPSEGGHVSFAPCTQHETDLLAQLHQRFDRVSIERVL